MTQVLSDGIRIQKGRKGTRKTLCLRDKGLKVSEREGWGIYYDLGEGGFLGLREPRKRRRKGWGRYCNKLKGRRDEERVKGMSKDKISAGGSM